MRHANDGLSADHGDISQPLCDPTVHMVVVVPTADVPAVGVSIEDKRTADADRVPNVRSNWRRHVSIFPLVALIARHILTTVDVTSVALLVFDASAVTVIVSKMRRPIVAKVSALMRRHRNHRWVRMLSANASRPPVRNGPARPQTSAGAAVRPIAVSAVPNSERRRVQL